MMRTMLKSICNLVRMLYSTKKSMKKKRESPMEKHIVWLLTAATALSLTACDGTEAASGDVAAGQETELVVFAAASLTETLDQIAEDYKTVAPDVTLTFNFDSSGTLKTQIEEGAMCDLFISAGQKQMDQLDATADPSVNTDRAGFLVGGQPCRPVGKQGDARRAGK